jgi:hypothetical protein
MNIAELGLPRWGRLAMSATGVVGSVTFFVVAFSPNLPMYGDSLTSWGSWAESHELDARRLAGLLLLTFALYLVFGIYVVTLVMGTNPWSALLVRVAIVAIGVRFAIEVMQVSVLSVPATADPRDFGGSMADLGAALSVMSLVPHAIFLGATGTAAVVSRAVPAWMGWFTLAAAAIQAVALLAGVAGIPLSPIGAVFGPVWFGSIPGWPLVTGVALLLSAIRRLDTRAIPAAAAIQ